MFNSFLKSPAGIIKISASDVAIERIEFVENKDLSFATNHIAENAKFQLHEYFSGTRKSFDLPFEIENFAPTAFFKNASNIISKIEYGTTISYGNIARELGGVQFSRAVGMVNARNPLAIIIPCHRVIGASNLGGYHYGLERKKWLLDFEKQVIDSTMAQNIWPIAM